MKPFHAAMLKIASVATRPHHARGTRIASPQKRATSNRPMAANGSVIARNVSGASSVTPNLRIGQLQPQTSVSTAMGTSERASGGLDGGAALLIAQP